MLGAYGVGAMRRRFWKEAKDLGVDPDLEAPVAEATRSVDSWQARRRA